MIHDLHGFRPAKRSRVDRRSDAKRYPSNHHHLWSGLGSRVVHYWRGSVEVAKYGHKEKKQTGERNDC